MSSKIRLRDINDNVTRKIISLTSIKDSIIDTNRKEEGNRDRPRLYLISFRTTSNISKNHND